MELANTIKQLFIDAIPTAILLLLCYLFLRAKFFGPLERVLAERRARTEGALREARGAQAAAQEKLRSYHEDLQKIRVEIHAEQETIRRAALEGRAELLRVTRARAHERVRAAKDRMAGELAVTLVELDGESHRLAQEIVQAILKRPLSGTRMGKEL